MEDGAPTHYLVVEGLAGEGSIWRVVRAEEHAKGRRLYAFVGTCQTRRAALSLARALNEKRAVDEATLRAAALKGQALPLRAGPTSRLRPIPIGSGPPVEERRPQALRFLISSR